MVLPSRSMTCLPRCFRPLTGMVLEHWISGTMQTSFRPLAGIVRLVWCALWQAAVFRPLTGISWNILWQDPRVVRICFRPLVGISWNGLSLYLMSSALCFRPLRGISWNDEVRLSYVQIKSSSPCGDKLKCSGGDVWAAQATFPSPHGDKLQFMKANVKINTLL